jgi:Holliday junction resolvase RusA-like endonuclease
MNPLVLRLPMPPSVNASYANVPGKGRVSTAALRTWKAAATAEILRALPAAGDRPVFRGCVEIAIRLPVPARGEPDADNRIKPVQDALVAAGIILDDSWRYVASSAARWVYDGSLGDQIEVSVTQIADAPAQRPQGSRTAAKRPSQLRAEPGSATGQRRASEATSPKRPSPRSSSAASETAVRVAIAAKYGIDPNRVHL